MCELILVFQLRGATKIDLPACFFFFFWHKLPRDGVPSQHVSLVRACVLVPTFPASSRNYPPASQVISEGMPLVWERGRGQVVEEDGTDITALFLTHLLSPQKRWGVAPAKLGQELGSGAARAVRVGVLVGASPCRGPRDGRCFPARSACCSP